MEKNRLLWASRRGMLELDLVLMPFLDKVYPQLSQADKERYWKLLEHEDQELFAWFLQRKQPQDEEMKRIVTVILEHTGMGATGAVNQ